MLLCPFPNTSERPAQDLGTHERVAGYCPKLCKLLLNFTPAFLQAVSVTGYVVVSQRHAQNSQITAVDRASCWLEEKSCVRTYKEEAAVALSSRVPGVCLANVELSRIWFGSAHSQMDFISCLSCSMARASSCSALCCQWDCICNKPTCSFLIVSLVGRDGICLFVVCF